MKGIRTALPMAMLLLMMGACNNESSTPTATDKPESTNTPPPATATSTPKTIATPSITDTPRVTTAPATVANAIPERYRGSGTGPNWEIEITPYYFRLTSSVKGYEQFNVQGNRPVSSDNGNNLSFHSVSGINEMKIELRKGACTNAKGGNTNTYKATVEIRRTTEKKFTVLKGCASAE